MRSSRDLVLVTWATLGVVGILLNAIVRLWPRAVEPILDGSLEVGGVAAYAFSIVFMAWSEGYRGFQRSFSPRVVARADGLTRGRRPAWQIVLAPVIAMGLIHATRRRLIASWILVTVIVGFVVLVRLLDQPWRGAVDAGVVVGLGWGSVTILLEWKGWLRGRVPSVATELPEGYSAQTPENSPTEQHSPSIS